MRTATIMRQPSTPAGTFGLFISDSGLQLHSLEKPWADNAPDVSCIPPGVYICKWGWSAKHGCNVYILQNVADRTMIEIHPANLAEQLLGCIALGEGVDTFAGTVGAVTLEAPTLGITNSQAAIAAFEKDFYNAETGQQDDIEITITREAA